MGLFRKREPLSTRPQGQQGVFRKMVKCPNRNCVNGKVPGVAADCGAMKPHPPHTFITTVIYKRSRETREFMNCSGQIGWNDCATCRGTGMVGKVR